MLPLSSLSLCLDPPRCENFQFDDAHVTLTWQCGLDADNAPFVIVVTRFSVVRRRVKKEPAVLITGSEGYKKYKAAFQFDARNPDELSLSVGDIVMVSVFLS